MKSIIVLVIIFVITGSIVYLFAIGTLEFNQENLNEPFQNIQKVGNSAKDFATETSTIIRETIDEHLEPVQLKPVDTAVDEISKIPKETSENNPLNKKPEFDISNLEQTVHKLTNQYRIQNGLEALLWVDELSNVARSHSQDMALRNYFSHDTPEGKDPTDRATLHGYKCEKIVGYLMYIGIAENIFQNNLYHTIWYTGGIPTSYDWNTLEDIAQTTVDGWMNSPGHRKNILTETFDRQGIGVAISSDDKVYITQNFC